MDVSYNDAAKNLILQRMTGAAAACGVPVGAGGATVTVITLQQGNSCSPSYSFWEAYTRTQWNPVAQLDIGMEVMYTQSQHRIQRPGGHGCEWLTPGSPRRCS